MVKSKKLSKILVTLILLLVTSFSIVFVAMQINKTTNDTTLSVSAVSDTSESNLSLTETYGIIETYSEFTYDTTYYSEPYWNGRIQCSEQTMSKRYSGRMYTIELNVDVREILWPFMDDVIVEFKFYYQEPTLGLKKTMKVSSMYISAKFYSNGVETANPTRSCSDKSSAGFTIQGGDKTDKVIVTINYNFYDDYNYMRRTAVFTFDGPKK